MSRLFSLRMNSYVYLCALLFLCLLFGSHISTSRPDILIYNINPLHESLPYVVSLGSQGLCCLGHFAPWWGLLWEIGPQWGTRIRDIYRTPFRRFPPRVPLLGIALCTRARPGGECLVVEPYAMQYRLDTAWKWDMGASSGGNVGVGSNVCQKWEGGYK